MTEMPSTSQPKWLSVLFSLVQFVGLIGFVIAEIVQLAQHGTTGFLEASLLDAIVWLIGVNGIVAGSGHLFFPDPVADSIGWPRGTPWQWEVGLAGLGWGVLGVMAPRSSDRSGSPPSSWRRSSCSVPPSAMSASSWPRTTAHRATPARSSTPTS